jgi:hypothetical protein
MSMGDFDDDLALEDWVPASMHSREAAAANNGAALIAAERAWRAALADCRAGTGCRGLETGWGIIRARPGSLVAAHPTQLRHQSENCRFATWKSRLIWQTLQMLPNLELGCN